MTKVLSDILCNMDEQQVTQLVLIDLSSAFDTVNHQLMHNIIEKSYGVSLTALEWIKSYLSGRSQQVTIGSTNSDKLSLDQGVPQGSCLGPVMFTQYASSIFSVIEKHDKAAHGYADDHQIYKGFPASALVEQSHSMELCVDEVREWMRSMHLKMNDSKTEYLLVGTQQQLSKCDPLPLSIGDTDILPSDCSRDLGAHLDHNLTMAQHIKVKCQAAYAQLHNIARIRKHLDRESAEVLIHGLVFSHIDYCNILLYGLPKCFIKKLQMVMNSAARVLCRIPKHEHISPTLKELHWLPVVYRIRFKMCVITFNALKGSGPCYIRDMLTIKQSGYRLRSSASILLEVPRMKHKTLGDRSFYSGAPREWNALPVHLRSLDNIADFKRGLKTHYFSIAY